MQVSTSSTDATTLLQQLLAGKIRTLEFSGGTVVVDAPRAGRIYLPGASWGWLAGWLVRMRAHMCLHSILCCLISKFLHTVPKLPISPADAPGSFNPLHNGHRELLAAACRMRGDDAEGCFELSVGNADKGLLPLEEIQRRLAQFTATGLPVVVTQVPTLSALCFMSSVSRRTLKFFGTHALLACALGSCSSEPPTPRTPHAQAPLFTMKADLFPRSSFAVGFDTAARLVLPQYYGTSEAMLLQFARLRNQGCGFLVGGRCGEGGRFMTLGDLAVPELLQRGGVSAGCWDVRCACVFSLARVCQ